MKYFGLLIIAIGILITFQQCSTEHKSVKLVFYNVENLFDTIDSPDTNDAEFLPESKLNWNTNKVNQKIKNLSKVLLSIDSQNPPALIGLCEVENREILSDLIQYSNLKKYNYQIIHKNSPDFRGIDVALLYRKGSYKPIKNEWMTIQFPFDSMYTTRDILYSKGKLNNGEVIHVFINHWTSRWSGQVITEAKRIYIAKLINAKTAQLLQQDPKANIIIMGDLNDNPTDKSLMEALAAKNPETTIQAKSLYNLSLSKFNNGEGTLFWKSWDLFDQVVVSGNLLAPENAVSVKGNTHFIFKEEWMLFADKNGNKRPSRTASRGKYYGGYSDHLPIWLELILN
jgi:endonuclease/exonuclease/phosphatase family metal-dependent hydrolase